MPGLSAQNAPKARSARTRAFCRAIGAFQERDREFWVRFSFLRSRFFSLSPWARGAGGAVFAQLVDHSKRDKAKNTGVPSAQLPIISYRMPDAEEPWPATTWLLAISSATLVLATTVIFVGIVPTAEGAFARDRVDLPGITKVLVYLSHLFCGNWLAIVVWIIPTMCAWSARAGHGIQIFPTNHRRRVAVVLGIPLFILALICIFTAAALYAPRITILQEVSSPQI